MLEMMVIQVEIDNQLNVAASHRASSQRLVWSTEAAINIIKHAQAKELVFSEEKDDKLVLDIRWLWFSKANCQELHSIRERLVMIVWAILSGKEPDTSSNRITMMRGKEVKFLVSRGSKYAERCSSSAYSCSQMLKKSIRPQMGRKSIVSSQKLW